jgi:hypothetical protein
MRSLKMIALWMAAIGLLLPQVGMVSAADLPSRTDLDQRAGQTTIMDVALTQDSLLRGQLINREGIPKPGTKMTLALGGRVVAQTVTDNQGVFALEVGKGGIYMLSDGEKSVMVRAWTNAAAPPSAQKGILVVSDQNVTRAALGNRPVATCALVAAFLGGTFALINSDDDDAS